MHVFNTILCTELLYLCFAFKLNITYCLLQLRLTLCWRLWRLILLLKEVHCLVIPCAIYVYLLVVIDYHNVLLSLNFYVIVYIIAQWFVLCPVLVSSFGLCDPQTSILNHEFGHKLWDFQAKIICFWYFHILNYSF